MRRTIPLLITALGGFVLIAAYFVPATQSWGEVAAVWFDVLASIAFVLGGGNLLKVHAKKISDKAKGWGYSGVTLVAFLGMLFVGLGKVGAPPAIQQEFYGQTFASLPLDGFPESLGAQVEGSIPKRVDGEPIPPSVRWQLSEKDGSVRFRGWMRGNQRDDLKEYMDRLDWRCQIEELYAASQPPSELKGRLKYYSDHGALSFAGVMSDSDRDALLGMSSEPAWTQAVSQLYQDSQRIAWIALDSFPAGIEIPADLGEFVTYDPAQGRLNVTGPLSAGDRHRLADRFPVARPLGPQERADLLNQLRSLGPVIEAQEIAFQKVLDGSWTREQLRTVVRVAGKAEPEDKTACELLDDRQGGADPLIQEHPAGLDAPLTPEHEAVIERFASQGGTADHLLSELDTASALTGGQKKAVKSFLGMYPRVGERNKTLCFRMMKVGPLNEAQREFLLADYRTAFLWRQSVGRLVLAAHTTKYPWSGEYRTQGTVFWWMYEYAFKPLTATMFAMLAFYVASAAFRAFRAKNFEAILLLGTAFIILLGRTFAGVLLTGWMPEWLSGLKIENLTVTIMSIFNTAGNRAIMIGIALGITSTSLKVLLGVDRSYLGSGKD